MPPQVSRLVLIFAFIGFAFVAIRWWAQPESFGQYGHYRGYALPEAVALPQSYVPKTSCADCHDVESAEHTAGPHKNVSCQICHGSGAAHIEDPMTTNIRKPDVTEACLRCHEAQPARPKKFPQIDSAEHADGEACNTCHVVHNPSETK